jgi:nucleoside-diphosphate-sugar epimerase
MHVLVTGAGGFLGRRVVELLRQRGHSVKALLRRPAAKRSHEDVQFVYGDVRDERDMLRACEGCQAVVHCAARAGPWGRWNDYYSVNTEGTLCLLRAARSVAVERFVYTSSPSVVFAGHGQSGINESTPYPKRWLAHYPHSKALAEQAVLQANGNPAATCALRPHLIWGEGDPHLAPRLWDRARRGRLVQVGSGRNLIDTTHIDNAAWAHVLAVERLAPNTPLAGRAYFLSDDDPVSCWAWIAQILELAGLPAPRRRIPFWFAYLMGGILELAYWVGRRTAEPPMTRFLAAQLALDHFYDIRAARADLAYAPLVTRAEGLQRWRDFLSRTGSQLPSGSAKPTS